MASIDRLPSGKWRVRWRNVEGQQQSRSFTTKADANAFRRKVESEVDVGLTVDRRLTVGEYVTRPGGWAESRRWRPSTRDAFDSHWRVHLEPRWGSVRLVAVEADAVQRWVNDMDAQGLAPATVEALYRRLVAIMRRAHSAGLISRQPIVDIVLPEIGPRQDRIHVPTDDQVHALATKVPDRYRALVWTIATLGLRPAEAIGLTVERIDFLRREVEIDRQLVTTTGAPPTLAPLKTRTSPRRSLPLPSTLGDMLAAHLAAHPAVEASGVGGPGHLVFTNNDGRPIRRGGLGDIWRRSASEAKLPPELRGWHCLRHYAITRLIAAGTNPDYVRQFAGHSRLTETLDVYSGWWPSDADHARAAIEAALAQGRRIAD